MKNILFTFTMLTAFNATSFSQTKLIEKIAAKPGTLVIPYEKHQLSNGLYLIIHEDHSDPIVHVDVTYHVGSNREEISKSGFAHFFEHMMFQGSDNVGDEQHFKIVSEAGGTLNGTTNSDRTNYFETLPSNQMEVALWLEADRMGFLLDAVTQEKFEIQRSTVKNERGQNYDNRPYGLAGEKTAQALYPYGHPYSWLTIGYIEDLNRSDVNDLKKFFMRWYGPNNATLTVAGDVNPVDVIKLAEKYFGSIPRGPEVKDMPKMPVSLSGDRYISYEDNIRFPLIQITFPTVNSFHEDEAPLDVLADIIGGGKNSILYKNMVKTQKAISANAYNPTRELAGEFVMSARAYTDKPLAEMEQMLRDGLAEFEKRGVSDDDLRRFKASHEADVIGSLESVSGKASQLASYNTFLKNPNSIQKDLDRYLSVTKEDVMRVYNKYLKGKYAVVLSVYPKGKKELATKPDDYIPPATGVVNNKVDYSGLVYIKATDNFDRSKKPVAGVAKAVPVPVYWTENFANGLKMIGTKNAEVPTVSVQLSIEAGHKMEAKDKTKAGLASLTASMMNEDSEKFTSEQFADTLDKLGSRISVSSDNQFITVNISCLKKNLEQTLRLAEERIFHPKFDAEDFNRLKKQQLENIGNQATQATVIASNVYYKLLYGNEHILSIPNIGTAETVGSITLEDVKNYYTTNFSPSIANLVVVGDVDKEAILPKLDFLKTWKAKEVKQPVLPASPAISKTAIYLVDKDKAPQSEFRIGYLALPFDATGEYYKATVMNYVLGGAFNSRVNLNLREDKGWTYGARSFFNGDKTIGAFTASAGIRGDATDSAVVEIMKELKNYMEKGITPEELEFTKSSIGQRDALKYETPWQKASFLRQIVVYNLDKTFVDKQNEILKAMTKTEVDALAKKHLPVNNMAIVIVGDSKVLKLRLVSLGYEVIELDNDGNKKKS